MLHLLTKLLRILNSQDSPAQVAWGVCLAAVVGLTPLLSLHNVLVVFVVLVFRINISAFLIFSIIFSALGYVLDPLFHIIGYGVLEAQSLRGLWTDIYNSSVGRLSNFNNTIVMGSLVFSIAVGIPLYFLVVSSIGRYREKFMPWVNKTRLVSLLKASKFYRLYTEIN